MQFVPRLPSLLLLGVVYVAYVLIGGAVFWKLEGQLEEQNQIELRAQKSRLFQKFTCLDNKALEELSQVRTLMGS